MPQAFPAGAGKTVNEVFLHSSLFCRMREYLYGALRCEGERDRVRMGALADVLSYEL